MNHELVSDKLIVPSTAAPKSLRGQSLKETISVTSSIRQESRRRCILASELLIVVPVISASVVGFSGSGLRSCGSTPQVVT